MKTDVVLDLKDKKLITNKGSEKIKFFKNLQMSILQILKI